MRQLFAYRADDPERKLSGIVLEVKGDLCRQLQRILKWCGREQDYVEVSLDGDIRYNPLNNSLDPYAQAFNIASIITSIWGKGREPFWQQSYTDLMRYVILLHRIRDGYLTMVDLFRTVISAGTLEAMLVEVGSRFSTASYIGIGKDAYQEYEILPVSARLRVATGCGPLSRRLDGASWSSCWSSRPPPSSLSIPANPIDPTSATASRASGIGIGSTGSSFAPRSRPRIIQGIVVFLSLFETDPQVRRVFCPPKELYEGKPCAADPNGRVLPPFDELIESGAVVGLNFPVALNPALAKTIGTMMKVDYQRAVQLRIPRMDADPEQHYRPTVFICDEYQNFATVGGDNPTGDERFLSVSPASRSASRSSLRRACRASRKPCPMKA